MFKIRGLDNLQKELKEARKALGDLDGTLGTVHFNPQDPESIEKAIQAINQIVDECVGQHSSNSIIDALADEMKQEYREQLLQIATEARLKNDEDE